MTDIVITDEMVELFARNRARQAIDPTQVDAYVDGLRSSQGWANVRAGLEAVAPLLRAQWEAERGCVLCNPGTPEQIGAREAASARLDALVERAESPVAVSGHPIPLGDTSTGRSGPYSGPHGQRGDND